MKFKIKKPYKEGWIWEAPLKGLAGQKRIEAGKAVRIFYVLTKIGSNIYPFTYGNGDRNGKQITETIYSTRARCIAATESALRDRAGIMTKQFKLARKALLAQADAVRASM